MKAPESMKAELSAWNNGAGIDLETWVANEGRFSLAVGYTSIFWPEFVEFDGYILRKGFSEDSLRRFERQQNGNRLPVDATMNHLHIADIQHYNCEDASKDKLRCSAMCSRKSTKPSSNGSSLISLVPSNSSPPTIRKICSATRYHSGKNAMNS